MFFSFFYDYFLGTKHNWICWLDWSDKTETNPCYWVRAFYDNRNLDFIPFYNFWNLDIIVFSFKFHPLLSFRGLYTFFLFFLPLDISSAICYIIRTTKRPVPLEHCIFYSGELYKICENENFLPQGLKAAKEVLKKKNLSSSAGGSGTYSGPSAAMHDAARAQRRENPGRGKQNKHSGSQKLGNFYGTGGGYQNSNGNQNNWGSRRSEASLWLLLINKLSKKSLLPVCRNIHCWIRHWLQL